MYYPFLRARQFELIALRELAIEKETQGVIVPILEPVKETHNNLTLAHRVFMENKQTAFLVVNSSTGELSGDSDYYLDYLDGLKSQSFFPAFHYTNNAAFINRCITHFELTNCMIICQNDVNPDDVDFRALVEKPEITTINVNDPNKSRTLNRFLKGLNKTYIRLDDFFEKRPRNSDYLEIKPQKFSEEHLYFEEDGFHGFSDYTVLPSEYIDGGSTPRAVVIHLTYLNLNEQNQIWVRHFTSETNDSIANVQGKFAEAAAKAVSYCRDNTLSNSAINELESLYDNQHYPGLGTVKKLSIKNHLLVLSKYLRNR